MCVCSSAVYYTTCWSIYASCLYIVWAYGYTCMYVPLEKGRFLKRWFITSIYDRWTCTICDQSFSLSSKIYYKLCVFVCVWKILKVFNEYYACMDTWDRHFDLNKVKTVFNSQCLTEACYSVHTCIHMHVHTHIHMHVHVHALKQCTIIHDQYTSIASSGRSGMTHI